MVIHSATPLLMYGRWIIIISIFIRIFIIKGRKGRKVANLCGSFKDFINQKYKKDAFSFFLKK